MKKPTPGRAKALSLCAMLVGLLICFLGMAFESMLLGSLSLLAIVVGMIINVMFYVCPHCGAHLGRGFCEYCSRCGEKIES